ncbi:hypothetical protein ACOSQ2_013437 [Xanthoceras sorbifolium]
MDLISKKVLLQGVLKHGLYVFNLPLPKSAVISSISQTTAPSFRVTSVFSPSKKCYVSAVPSPASLAVTTASQSLFSPLQLWHIRLGHPSSFIVQSILHKCKVKFPNTTYLFCGACQLSKSHKLPFTLLKTV